MSVMVVLPLLSFQKRSLSKIALFILIVLTILFSVIRDVTFASDFSSYEKMYSALNSFEDIFTAYHGDYFFSLFQFLGRSLGLGFIVFSKLFTMMLVLFSFIGIRMFLNDKKTTITVLSLYLLTSTSFFMYVNTIRQGLAVALLFIAVGLISNGNRYKAHFILFLSFFSHTSAIIPIICILIAYNKKISNKQYKLILYIIPISIFFPDLFFYSYDFLNFKNNSIDFYLTNPGEFHIKDVLKLSSLYVFAIVFYIFGSRSNWNVFNNNFQPIFTIYLLLTFAIFLAIPVPIISTRLIYYASAWVPVISIMYFYSMFYMNNIDKKYGPVLLLFTFSIMYGSFVFSFKSILTQLGINY